MLSLAVYAAILAHGRVSKPSALHVWFILIAVAVVTSLISAQMMGMALGEARVLLGTFLQLILLILLYVAGAMLGRWLDRDKDFR